MNTGFLGPAVATVLTVYGIETLRTGLVPAKMFLLQQCLPFTVLKLRRIQEGEIMKLLQQCLPFTVLKLIFYIVNCFTIAYYSCNSAYRLRY